MWVLRVQSHSLGLAHISWAPQLWMGDPCLCKGREMPYLPPPLLLGMRVWGPAYSVKLGSGLLHVEINHRLHSLPDVSVSPLLCIVEQEHMYSRVKGASNQQLKLHAWFVPFGGCWARRRRPPPPRTHSPCRQPWPLVRPPRGSFSQERGWFSTFGTWWH